MSFFASNFKQDETFTTVGFFNWKKIWDKCKRQNESKIHPTADEKRKSYFLNEKAGRLDPNFRDERMTNDNKKNLMTVLDIHFCAQQKIPFRDNDESIDSLNRGNFLRLISLLCQYNPSIKERLNKLPENAKMLSSDIQNEILEESKQELLEQNKQETHVAWYFSIVADKVNDVSEKELLGVFFRYTSEEITRQRAIGNVELTNMDAISITEYLLHVLQLFQLPQENCVDQGSDKASVVAGKDGGV